jgi:septum formation protein
LSRDGRFSTAAALEQMRTVWKTRIMLILASQSSARKALLAGTGLRFETSPAQIDERGLEAEVLGKGGDAVAVARHLAEAKAIAVSVEYPDAVVIGADQVLKAPDMAGDVDHGVIPAKAGTSVLLPPAPSQTEVPASAGMTRWVGDILHKPESMAAARKQLYRLRGQTHQLHSGVALAREGEVLWSEVVTASLTMRSFSPSERDAVLALEGDAVLGSVGGYRLEGPSIRLFERIEGDYFTVLGLPLLPLLAALRQHAPETLTQ